MQQKRNTFNTILNDLYFRKIKRLINKWLAIDFKLCISDWFQLSENVIWYIEHFKKSECTLNILSMCNIKFQGHIFITFVYVCMYVCINRYSKKYHLIYVIALSTTLCKRAYYIYLVCRWVLLLAWFELFFITKNRSADIGLLNFI